MILKKSPTKTHLPLDLSDDMEGGLRSKANEIYILRLYVAGNTPQSIRAIANIKEVCEQHLKNRFKLEVIDIYQHPKLTHEAQIIAAPTLVKTLPLPVRKLIGDLTDRERVLLGLDLTVRSEGAKT